VVVEVELKQENGERLFENVPVVVRGDAAGRVETIPEQVRVTLFGPVTKVKVLEGALEAELTVNSVPAKPTPFEIQLYLLPDVTLVSIMPRLVSVAARSRP